MFLNDFQHFPKFIQKIGNNYFKKMNSSRMSRMNNEEQQKIPSNKIITTTSNLKNNLQLSNKKYPSQVEFGNLRRKHSQKQTVKASAEKNSRKGIKMNKYSSSINIETKKIEPPLKIEVKSNPYNRLQRLKRMKAKSTVFYVSMLNKMQCFWTVDMEVHIYFGLIGICFECGLNLFQKN